MNRYDFSRELADRLKTLEASERKEIIDYYNEMISERMEDGSSEQEAIEALGTPKDIAEKILQDKPTSRLAKAEKPKARKRSSGKTVALVLTSPVWVPLVAAFLVLVLAFFIVLWACVVSLYAVFVSFMACGVTCLVMGTGAAIGAGVPAGLVYYGAGFLLLGFGILVLLFSNLCAKGAGKLCKIICRGVKSLFFGRKR